MRTRFRLLSGVLFAALVTVGLNLSSAEAVTVPKVYGVTLVKADTYLGKFTVRWKAVSRATYQVRWATTTAKLGSAKLYAARTSSFRSPVVNVCSPWYVQVRAIKSRRAGAWSTARKVTFPVTPRYADLISAGFAGTGGTDKINFTWKAVPNATRYRVRWFAAPPQVSTNTYWPGRPNGYVNAGAGWLPKTARSTSLSLNATPAPGDQLTGVSYGNPVFAQLQAGNVCAPLAAPITPYRAYFPAPRVPGPDGDLLRFASYNIERFSQLPTPVLADRLGDLAANIASRDLGVVALQEAIAADAADLITALASAGQSDWTKATSGSASTQQIIYRADRYTETGAGDFGQAGPPQGVPALTPWVRLQQDDPSDPVKSQTFLVTSVHLSEPSSTDVYVKKATLAAAANVIISGLAAQRSYATEPVIAAGDLRGMLFPYCDENSVPTCTPEAQPTFIRAGYYDALAAVSKTGIQFGTVNGHNAVQPTAVSGFAQRADYILLNGFGGSLEYVNVANQTYGGATPSDHNLILAKVRIPLTE